MGMTTSAVIRDYSIFDEGHHDPPFMVKQFAAPNLEVHEPPDVQADPEIEAMPAVPQKVWLSARWFCVA
jgi:hypothetical protein